MATIEFTSHPLEFKSPARTSRDTLISKPCFFLSIEDDEGRRGTGECSLIPGLSLESEKDAREALEQLTKLDSLHTESIPHSLPAVKFAVETALIDLKREGTPSWIEGIPINGLVWMDNAEGMLKQVDILIAKGYKTIKIKVGTLPFYEELELLKEIRRRCPSSDFTLRIDANGAFSNQSPDGLTALEKLQILYNAGLDLHSIEQPISPGLIEEMAELCASSPVPIALDEELIQIRSKSEKRALLEKIRPAYLVLKPSLLGGLKSAESWITLAESLSIGWWTTSALESNVGLAEIAEWTSELLKSRLNLKGMAQGLGTGSLYRNNIASTLLISDGKLYSSPLHSELKWTQAISTAIENWFAHPKAPLSYKTSGSSGPPREITHSRDAVIASAKETLAYFNLKPGDRVVLSLPVNFIAGHMMLVRAIVGGLALEIVEPTRKPDFKTPADFIALTPNQCFSLLPDFPPVKKVLLGGGFVSDDLIERLPERIDFYEGFGMTETITHIAIRKLQRGSSKSPFVAMPGVCFRISKDRELIVDAPSREVTGLVTDDLVELIDSKKFVWLGRKSSIINSGGIKVMPEVVEQEIREVIKPLGCEYMIKGMPDESLGEKVTLLLDTPELTEENENELLAEIGKLKKLAAYHAPKRIVYGKVIRSHRGKLKRN
jgi:o-succinylbenzoate synthase